LGYRSKSGWQHVIRDIGVDLQKGIIQASTTAAAKKNQKISKSKIVIQSLAISTNSGCLFDNFTLSQNENLEQFFQAANWFVRTQDEKGGWSIPVRRKFGADFYPVLEPGWYSSMAQGHAISLLARAYALTKQSKYSDACSKALKTIFDRSGEKNMGVRAVFMNQYPWFEEYPTKPSTFVLNGFMYSLLGLYDVRKLGVPGAAEKAGKLYEEGVKSLIKMLPLYDTGSGTMYDLRHFTVPGIAPNLARLDYHVTHINQLLTFATIHEDPIFSATAERWIAYTEGVRASHN
jgi:heparosan-N-sulfate-glucuronate 5-epimerase